MNKWEYHTKTAYTETNNLGEKELDKLGVEGWELVTVHRIEIDKLNWGQGGRAAYVYFFKRLQLEKNDE